MSGRDSPSRGRPSRLASQQALRATGRRSPSHDGRPAPRKVGSAGSSGATPTRTLFQRSYGPARTKSPPLPNPLPRLSISRAGPSAPATTPSSNRTAPQQTPSITYVHDQVLARPSRDGPAARPEGGLTAETGRTRSPLPAEPAPPFGPNELTGPVRARRGRWTQLSSSEGQGPSSLFRWSTLQPDMPHEALLARAASARARRKSRTSRGEASSGSRSRRASSGRPATASATLGAAGDVAGVAAVTPVDGLGTQVQEGEGPVTDGAKEGAAQASLDVGQRGGVDASGDGAGDPGKEERARPATARVTWKSTEEPGSSGRPQTAGPRLVTLLRDGSPLPPIREREGQPGVGVSPPRTRRSGAAVNSPERLRAVLHLLEALSQGSLSAEGQSWASNLSDAIEAALEAVMPASIDSSDSRDVAGEGAQRPRQRSAAWGGSEGGGNRAGGLGRAGRPWSAVASARDSWAAGNASGAAREGGGAAGGVVGVASAADLWQRRVRPMRHRFSEKSDGRGTPDPAEHVPAEHVGPQHVPARGSSRSTPRFPWRGALAAEGSDASLSDGAARRSRAWARDGRAAPGSTSLRHSTLGPAAGDSGLLGRIGRHLRDDRLATPAQDMVPEWMSQGRPDDSVASGSGSDGEASQGEGDWEGGSRRGRVGGMEGGRDRRHRLASGAGSVGSMAGDRRARAGSEAAARKGSGRLACGSSGAGGGMDGSRPVSPESEGDGSDAGHPTPPPIQWLPHASIKQALTREASSSQVMVDDSMFRMIRDEASEFTLMFRREIADHPLLWVAEAGDWEGVKVALVGQDPRATRGVEKTGQAEGGDKARDGTGVAVATGAVTSAARDGGGAAGIGAARAAADAAAGPTAQAPRAPAAVPLGLPAAKDGMSGMVTWRGSAAVPPGRQPRRNELGVDLEDRNWLGDTALHVAARTGNSEIVRLLLKQGADPLAQSNTGAAALHEAARVGSVGAARILLLHARTEERRVLAQRMEAAKASGDPAAAEAVVGHPDLAGGATAVCDLTGKTPLHYAVMHGFKGVVDLLLREFKADKEARDHLGYTPLHMAARKGYNDLVRVLRSLGADPSPEDKVGWTPLTHAAALGHVNVVRTFVQDLKCDTGHRTRHGESLLHVAARHGQARVIEYLCNVTVLSNVEMNATSRAGMTPLQCAAAFNHEEAARLLIKHGADATAELVWGMRPHDVARVQGHRELGRTLRLLMEEQVAETQRLEAERAAVEAARREQEERERQAAAEAEAREREGRKGKGRKGKRRGTRRAAQEGEAREDDGADGAGAEEGADASGEEREGAGESSAASAGEEEVSGSASDAESGSVEEHSSEGGSGSAEELLSGESRDLGEEERASLGEV